MSDYKKIGKTSFNVSQALDMGYKDFKATYSNVRGVDVDFVWQELGGTVEKPKPVKKDVRKD